MEHLIYFIYRYWLTICSSYGAILFILFTAIG